MFGVGIIVRVGLGLVAYWPGLSSPMVMVLGPLFSSVHTAPYRLGLGFGFGFGLGFKLGFGFWFCFGFGFAPQQG